ncbi:hypothetical protein Q8A67_022623 [Cirrhinus molitorella]|uniref:Uncharacterized protein n=1 Tax=Cirrhinus molitorella TaxID=172907 RepID=A0AA88P884_9TELE|nr:hypothetical protein Q8A67_022623 [Cirrhinus molitorella]
MIIRIKKSFIASKSPVSVQLDFLSCRFFAITLLQTTAEDQLSIDCSQTAFHRWRMTLFRPAQAQTQTLPSLALLTTCTPDTLGAHDSCNCGGPDSDSA